MTSASLLSPCVRRSRFKLAVAFIALPLAMVLGGCASRPPGQRVVNDVSLRGASAVSEGDVLERIATQPSSTLLGLMTLTYEAYEPSVIERDVARIQRYYAARGYHSARVTAARVQGDRKSVRVAFFVEEGPPSRIGSIRFELVTPADPLVGRIVQSTPGLRVGDIINEEEYDTFKERLVDRLKERGFAHARLAGGFPPGPNDVPTEETPSVQIDAVGHVANVVLRIDAGPRCRFGTISVVGQGDLVETQLLATIAVAPGDPYETSALDMARQSLLKLGLFASVVYEIPPDDARPTRVPVVFRVVRAPTHNLTLGGGVQADVLRTDGHLLVGYEQGNFLGGLRRLTTQVRPALVLYPTNLQNVLPPERILPEARTFAELRQPNFFEGRTTGKVRTEANLYPFLLPIRNRSEVPASAVGYRELREVVGAERTFFNDHVTISGDYNLQVSYPFTYIGSLVEGLDRVLVSYISLSQAIDFRNDPISPHKGAYFHNEVQFAGGPFGGNADDIRVQPEARFYIPLSRRLTLAARGTVGFLFPRSYGSALDDPEPTDQGASFNRARTRDQQLLSFRAFYAGGPNSNRGYALRGLGPRGIARYQLSASPTCRLTDPATGQGLRPPIDECGLPLGGLSSWESSLELRLAVSQAITLTTFLDGSDVTIKRLALRFNYPHLSTGVGLRYATPAGPLRLDVGYALPGLQKIGGRLDPNVEGLPATVFKIPIALSIAIGEAF